jgi:hypothetical protein
MEQEGCNAALLPVILSLTQVSVQLKAAAWAIIWVFFSSSPSMGEDRGEGEISATRNSKQNRQRALNQICFR